MVYFKRVAVKFARKYKIALEKTKLQEYKIAQRNFFTDTFARGEKIAQR